MDLITLSLIIDRIPPEGEWDFIIDEDDHSPILIHTGWLGYDFGVHIERDEAGTKTAHLRYLGQLPTGTLPDLLSRSLSPTVTKELISWDQPTKRVGLNRLCWATAEASRDVKQMRNAISYGSEILRKASVLHAEMVRVGCTLQSSGTYTIRLSDASNCTAPIQIEVGYHSGEISVQFGRTSYRNRCGFSVENLVAALANVKEATR